MYVIVRGVYLGVGWPPVGYPWIAHGVAHGVSLGRAWGLCGLFVGRHVVSVGCPWGDHGLPMDCTWGVRGVYVGLSLIHI